LSKINENENLLGKKENQVVWGNGTALFPSPAVISETMIKFYNSLAIGLFSLTSFLLL